MAPTAQRATDDEPRTDRGSALRRLIRGRDFRNLLIGQGISGFGDWMATVALMAIVLNLTGSSLAVGGILVLRLAPTAVAGPLTGKIANRWDRRRTMLAMDAARIGVALAIPLVATLWWVYLWAFLLEVAGLVFLPARDAAIPDLIEAGSEEGDGDDLSLANGLVLGSSYGMIPIGAAAFGAISAVMGDRTNFPTATDVVFWVNALTFAASFIAIWRIRGLEGREPSGQSDEPPTEQGDQPGVSFTDAFRLPLVRVVAPVAFVVALGLGSLFSLGIVYVRQVVGASNTEFGILVAGFGVGAAVGLGLVHLLIGRSLTVLRWAVATQGLVVAGMSLATTIWPAYAGAIGFGAATAVALTGAMSNLQDRLADDERVMAFSAFHVLIRGGLAVAALGAGAAADLLSELTWPLVGTTPPAQVVLFASGVLVLITAVVSGDLEQRARRAEGEG